MKYIIDRIEEDVLVLEDEEKNIIDFKISDKKIKSQNYREGDVIELNENGTITLLHEETLKRRKKIEDKLKDMWQ